MLYSPCVTVSQSSCIFKSTVCFQCCKFCMFSFASSYLIINSSCIEMLCLPLNSHWLCFFFFFDRQRDLFQVLKAYSILNSNVGYCQAQAPLAAFLLMHMPAEQAFWCLVSICDKYLAGYYSQGMVSPSAAFSISYKSLM